RSISRFGGGFRRRISLNLLLQLRQQVQSLERSEVVQVNLTQFFEHRLRQGREDGELRRRRHRSVARGKLRAQPRFGILVFGQHLARPPYHFRGKAGQLRHFDAVTAVGRARFHFAQKNDSASRLLRPHVVVLHPRKLLGKFGQLEVVGGEQRLCPSAGVQV